MGVSLSGDNITVPGQVAVALTPTSPTHVVRKSDITALRAVVLALNLNAAAPIDLTALIVPSTKYIPRRVVVLNATANLSVAELALYTAAGGAGTAIVAPTVLTALTAAGKYQVLTIAALSDPIVAGTLYPRLSIASGVAGTVDLLFEFDDVAAL